MAEQYCFLGWLHHILWPFILPTVKQQGIVEVHCSSSLFKLWSASPEAVPLNNGKQNRSLSLSAGTCSMQHCINAIPIILEWREKQNVQLKLCLVQFLTEFTTWERCQIEGFGQQSPPFNRSVRKEQEQPSKAPPSAQPSSDCRCPSPYTGNRVLQGGRKSESSHLFTACSPSWHLHSHPALCIYDGALWPSPDWTGRYQLLLAGSLSWAGKLKAPSSVSPPVPAQGCPWSWGTAAPQELLPPGDSRSAQGHFSRGSGHRAGQVQAISLRQGLDSQESSW